MRMIFLALSASLVTTPALATSVALNSDVFIERISTDGDGKRKVTLEEPKVVVPGDRLVFVLNYRNASGKPADKFVVTNPMPTAVQFAEQADDNAVVSIDGGKNWGSLAELRVVDVSGEQRPARTEDVTHIRWSFNQPIPVGGSGKLMFRGVVK